MPLYAYRCTQCGHRFEKIQNFSAEPETDCPKCGGVLERPFTAPRLQFKGAGWYVNDYASKSSESTSESASSESKDSTTKPSETKKENTAPASNSAPAALPPQPQAHRRLALLSSNSGSQRSCTSAAAAECHSETTSMATPEPKATVANRLLAHSTLFRWQNQTCAATLS